MAQVETKDGIPAMHVVTRSEWRAWLDAHHATATKVWLIIYAKGTGVPSVQQAEAVEEALCYGWIDSKSVKRDARSRYQYFCPRKPKSIWSKVNKGRIAALLADGKMMPAGLHTIEVAKANGMWTFYDAVEETVIPDDLAAAFATQPEARKKFDAFSRSARKLILYWIVSAKGADTRARRVAETVAKAAMGLRSQ